MAGLSDGLLVASVIGYLAAMVAHAVELATRDRVLVAAPPAGAGAGRSRGAPRLGEAAGPVAVAVTAGATLTHAGCLLARGLAADRVPLGNMYEFVLAVGLAGAVGWLVLLARRPAGGVRGLGLFVTLALALLLGVAGRIHTRVEPLVPALASPWLRVHVGAAALATGLLLVGFVAAALYALRLRHDALVGAGRRAATTGTVGRLPAPETLDRLAARMHQLAFPIWTFAILAGAIWAEAAWGRYWGWDPKESWAFVSWTLYACYLHARSTAGWRGRPAALVAMVAFATMLVNLFVVNLAFSGLHSYAGL
jgi:cytochrome c-type biogenesis protein CcsB